MADNSPGSVHPPSKLTIVKHQNSPLTPPLVQLLQVAVEADGWLVAHGYDQYEATFKLKNQEQSINCADSPLENSTDLLYTVTGLILAILGELKFRQ